MVLTMGNEGRASNMFNVLFLSLHEFPYLKAYMRRMLWGHFEYGRKLCWFLVWMGSREGREREGKNVSIIIFVWLET
jgi:hypothetical protein